METTAPQLFADVARYESFAPAARHRGLGPSFASRIIAALERNQGIRLFQRTTRHLSLTEAGQRCLHRIAPPIGFLRAQLSQRS